ncbi:MAG: efflux RND transporter permease subunit [Gammaproteobacteria bacterium]|nr:efflux RND transporter permease subunit [Gammaproteobacteria bacterium]
MRFTDIFIERPVLATVVSLLILFAGLRSLQVLTVSQYPDSKSAVVTVTTVYPGADANLIQGFITTPLEREIAGADGIDYLQSSSLQGISVITAQLELDYDPWDALTQITSKVNRVRDDLPAGSEDPTIDIAIGETTADMYLSFDSDSLPQNQITDYLVRVVLPRVEAVAGVQEAEIIGGRFLAMRIWLDPLRMTALGVTPRDVRRALEANNYQAAVGETKGQAIAVKLRAATDLNDAEQFRDLVLREEAGAIVRLRDVADVVLGAEDYEVSTTYDGVTSVAIGVYTLPDANTLTVIRNVRELFPDIVAQLPPGVLGHIPYDRTLYIDDAIREVVKTLVEAALIVSAVIFLFLGNIRSVAIPIVAIPVSLIGVASMMLLLGYSINLLTLLALVIAIGLVVDDAIIVVENIQRHIEDGMQPMQAALRGARELFTPVIAMTITLVAVYAPIGFSSGLTGSLFSEFAFTLAGAVIISGVVALTLSPAMCARLLHDKAGNSWLEQQLNRLFDGLRERYLRLLSSSLNYLPVTVLFSVTVLGSIYFMFITAPQELAPMEDQGILLVTATATANTSTDQLASYTSALDAELTQIPEVGGTFLFNGSPGRGPAANNLALAGMILKPWRERERFVDELMPEAQARADKIAGLQSVAFALPTLPGAGSGLPVQVVIGAPNPPDEVYQVAQELLGRAWQSGLFTFVDVDMKYDRAQGEITIDRDMAATLGIDMEQLGDDLATMLGGNYVNRFNFEGRSYKVIPQVQRRYRLNPEQLREFQVASRSGELVPLGALVRVNESVQPQRLQRFQQQNSAKLSAVPVPGVSIGDALEFLEAQAAEIFPRGFQLDYAGQSRQYVKERGTLIVTFFFALLVIYLVLAAQFESFRDPLIMLVSVPMSIAGALLFLTLGFATVNIYTQVGLITLIGLISKHGILIVQFANQLQIDAGLGKRAAIEQAASIRLRPILMTTGAMSLGVVPLLLASGAGAEARFDIGLVIFTGMTIGTLFTIFVVPAIYLLLARDHQAMPATSPSPARATASENA